MLPVKIQPLELSQIIQNTKRKSEEAIGLYLFNGFRIQVSRYLMDGGNRVRILYNKRRNQGLCIVCQKKVKRINPSTGKLYRLCDVHRTSIAKERNKNRVIH